LLTLLASQAAISLENARLYSELREAEQKLRRHEEELREILDVVPNHIAVFDPAVPLYANRVLLDYYGLSLEQLQAAENDIRAFAMHPDDRARYLAARDQRFASSSAWETELRFRRRDGEYRWFLVRGTPLRDEEGRTLRWYISSTDIDDR